jgi:hypothetical protein
LTVDAGGTLIEKDEHAMRTVSDPKADSGARSDGQLGLLLACFDGRKTAGNTRRGLEGRLRAQGNELLDTVVLEVDEKHKASVHDPRRILWGTAMAALVWGVWVGSGLPARSSALAVWVGTKDARRLLEAAAVETPTAATVATIGTDLRAHVLAGPADPVESPPGSADAAGSCVQRRWFVVRADGAVAALDERSRRVT